MRARTILYVFLALTVPTGAFALTGGDETAAPAESLTVTASLEGCGIAADSIVCKIDASWNDVPGATRYTASVARADGSVVDYGDVGAGSAGFWVPYAGNGTYTVTVSAYGTPPGASDQEVIAKGSSSAGHGGKSAEGIDAGEIVATADGDPGDEGGATDDPTCDEPDPDEPPVGEEPGEPAPPQAGEVPAQAAPAEGTGSDELSADDEDALAEDAQEPESVDCPE